MPAQPRRPRRPARHWTAALMALLVLTTTACTREGVAPWPPCERCPAGPVVLLGIDGVEWRLVLELIAEGELPNLRNLIEGGVAGRLKTLHPSLSPIIWTSMATGMKPPEHGILGFLRRKDARGGNDSPLYTNYDRKKKALWNILSDAGRPSTVIGWWMTFPVEPIEGVMVAQSNTTTGAMRKTGDGIWKGSLEPGLAAQVHPADVEREVLDLVPAVEERLDGLVSEIFGDLPLDADKIFPYLWKQSLWSIRADAIYTETARMLLARRAPFDFFTVYLGGTDVLGHRLWRYRYPEEFRHPPSKRARAAYARVLGDYYRHADRVVGELVAAAPPDANVIVVSDHGMTAGNKRGRFHPGNPRKLGSGTHGADPHTFFAAAGPAFRRRSEPFVAEAADEVPVVGHIYDVAPTVLAILGEPVGEDMAGRVLVDFLRPDFTERNPVRTVASHTPADWEQSREVVDLPPAGIPERLEQLRTLGYIE